MCVREKEREKICMFALIVYLVLFTYLFLLELAVITGVSMKWQFFSLFMYLLSYLLICVCYLNTNRQVFFFTPPSYEGQIPSEGNDNDDNTSHLLIIPKIKALQMLCRHDVISLIMKSFFAQWMWTSRRLKADSTADQRIDGEVRSNPVFYLNSGFDIWTLF